MVGAPWARKRAGCLVICVSFHDALSFPDHYHSARGSPDELAPRGGAALVADRRVARSCRPVACRGQPAIGCGPLARGRSHCPVVMRMARARRAGDGSCQRRKHPNASADGGLCGDRLLARRQVPLDLGRQRRLRLPLRVGEQDRNAGHAPGTAGEEGIENAWYLVPGWAGVLARREISVRGGEPRRRVGGDRNGVELNRAASAHGTLSLCSGGRCPRGGLRLLLGGGTPESL